MQNEEKMFNTSSVLMKRKPGKKVMVIQKKKSHRIKEEDNLSHRLVSHLRLTHSVLSHDIFI